MEITMKAMPVDETAVVKIVAVRKDHKRSNDLFENESTVDEIEQPAEDSFIFEELPLWKQAFRLGRVNNRSPRWPTSVIRTIHK
jgi:hypothetical protein